MQWSLLLSLWRVSGGISRTNRFVRRNRCRGRRWRRDWLRLLSSPESVCSNRSCLCKLRKSFTSGGPNLEIPLPASANTQASPAIAPKAVSRQARPHSSEPEVVIDPREAAAFRSFIEDVREQKIDPASLESLFQAAESAEAAEIAPMPIAGLEPIDIKPLNPAVTERGGSL